jgi:hypothetical protein
MCKIILWSSIFVTLPVICILSSVAQAVIVGDQFPRTWVSGSGNDGSADCSRSTPCLTFAGAIVKTIVGGEIDALDPGDLGPVIATKAITIDGAVGRSPVSWRRAPMMAFRS